MLSEKIYTLRRERGLSQEQLAEKIGVSRQAISKWEGGLSTPELDKLKALSECFQISIDELTENQPESASADSSDKDDTDDTPKKKEELFPHKAGESKIGICLCIIGAVCLLFFGILTVIHPSSVGTSNESFMITLNGTGMLITLFVLLMIFGIIMILKRK